MTISPLRNYVVIYLVGLVSVFSILALVTGFDSMQTPKSNLVTGASIAEDTSNPSSPAQEASEDVHITNITIEENTSANP